MKTSEVVLNYIKANPNISSKMLYESMGLSRGMVVYAIKVLMKRKLICKISNIEGDMRYKHLVALPQ
jgi:DNA-binding MarR family transcriptional regulator